MKSRRIGAAIAAFDNKEQLANCIESLISQVDFIAICDDGCERFSNAEYIKRKYPSVHYILGDGTNWWAAGTNIAIRKCLEKHCNYVLLVNPDIMLELGSIDILTRVSEENGSIAASLVLDKQNPTNIRWAGSKWGVISSMIPVWTSRYIAKAGDHYTKVGEEPYETSEAHGRGVLVPRKILLDVGLIDEDHFPHYGADIDFAFRVRRKGYRILVVPKARSMLNKETTGIKREAGSVGNRLRRLRKYLTKRKHGDALRVWAKLVLRHVPWYGIVPTYWFIIILNVYRLTMGTSTKENPANPQK